MLESYKAEAHKARHDIDKLFKNLLEKVETVPEDIEPDIKKGSPNTGYSEGVLASKQRQGGQLHDDTRDPVP